MIITTVKNNSYCHYIKSRHSEINTYLSDEVSLYERMSTFFIQLFLEYKNQKEVPSTISTSQPIIATASWDHNNEFGNIFNKVIYWSEVTLM